MPQKWVIAANGDPTNEPPWGSTLKIETGAENIMPTPPAGGQEISFAPQMIFLWPPARGVGKKSKGKYDTNTLMILFGLLVS